MRSSLIFGILAAFLPISQASATVSISFSAGVIRQADSSIVPLNSIGILVADKANDGFGTSSSLVGSTLNVGSTLGGSDNQILQIFTYTADVGGFSGFLGDVSYDYANETFTAGTSLALFWFPTLTAVGVNGVTATTGLTLGVGVNYGFYRTSSTDGPNGGSFSDIAFFAPADGSNVNLYAFDNATISGALATPANLTALSYTAVPEPTSLALLGMGGLLVAGTALRRRRKVA